MWISFKDGADLIVVAPKRIVNDTYYKENMEEFLGKPAEGPIEDIGCRRFEGYRFPCPTELVMMFMVKEMVDRFCEPRGKRVKYKIDTVYSMYFNR